LHNHGRRRFSAVLDELDHKMRNDSGYFRVVKLACRDADCRFLFANFFRAINVAGQ